jgi:hypothetical protein
VGMGGDGGAATRGIGPESTVIVLGKTSSVNSQAGSIISVLLYLVGNSTGVRPRMHGRLWHHGLRCALTKSDGETSLFLRGRFR